MPLISLNNAELDITGLTTQAGQLKAVDVHVKESGPISLELNEEQVQAVHKELNAASLQVGIVRSDIGIDDIGVIANTIELAKGLDCEFITVNVPSYNADYRSLLGDTRGCYFDLNQISSETGVDSLISLDPGSICPTADAAMRILEGLDPSQVGVLFDPSTCPQDIKRSVDVLGPFLRAICCSADQQDLVKATLDAMAETEEVLISVAGNDAASALKIC